MSLLLTIAKEYKRLCQDAKAAQMMTVGTVSNYTTFKKWTTSRKEKNPSLRMRWAMSSKFPIIANKRMLEEAQIPKEHNNVALWEDTEDVSKRDHVLASASCINYWNFCGPCVNNSEVIKEVYKSRFGRLERRKEIMWKELRFTLVDRQRRRVDTQPVEQRLRTGEIKDLQMWTLFEDEAPLASKFILDNYGLVKEMRSKFANKPLNKEVVAHMLEKQFNPESRFLPVFGAIRPERMELIHALGGETWIQEANTAGISNVDQRKNDIRAVCRKVCLAANASIMNAKSKLVEYIKSTSMRIGETERKLEELILETDDVSPEVTLCKSALGGQLGKTLSFGPMLLKKISGSGVKVKDTVYIQGVRAVQFEYWSEQEEFYGEYKSATALFSRKERSLEWITIGGGINEDRKRLLAMCMIFCRDGDYFKDAPATITMADLSTKLGREIPYQYVMMNWIQKSEDNLEALLYSRGIVETNPGKMGSSMGIDGSKRAIKSLRAVTIQSGKIDMPESKEKIHLELSDNLEAFDSSGRIVATILDLPSDKKVTFQDVSFQHPDLAVLRDEKTAITKGYEALIKRLGTGDNDIPSLIAKKDYLSLYNLPEVKLMAPLIRPNRKGVYSRVARKLVSTQVTTGHYSLHELIKVLPFTYFAPKQGMFEGRLFFSNDSFVEPGVNNNVFSWSKADSSKIYCHGIAIRVPLVVGDEHMDTSLALLEGFSVCENDPRAPMVTRQDLIDVGFGQKVRLFVGQGSVRTFKRTASQRAASSDVNKNVKKIKMSN
uniref:Polymerase basic protein 2 n=89 Tax=Influenza C virus TaxID=11552 RepID=PB2_INCJH|nr:RecName: Full=Polymerase basic protein 2; AltName: Full=RNA-directed RNA polymerase subunit P3 [Influenza C virus (C/Johannesburg/1/66)]6F5P_E Chain E, Polymerase basic protein 2 [Influenza C virus (C/Johannesburg/1/66)]6F5P_F Chain F, Polymerase basic protein 2 [Influenza C virus (C/Johannesburg/1/66)]6XZD_CP1 Chain CP1, Polymerase basic protein 2 [Influenza C virus (C/Johannesburg/1/66)]6XZD_FP1 Chain FP1, Polymerase basic protein 2 [Influenza C virus (C/Johannesburg/1/66)]AAF89739.2 poly